MTPHSYIAIWSAVPTPLTPDYRIDDASVERMIEAAIEEGVSGVFLGGTCGEGPWLQDRERLRLIRVAALAAGGRLKIAAQVSDNSPLRVLDNTQAAAQAGADIAVVTVPALFMNATAERLKGFFAETAKLSPLPIGVYDLGKHRPIQIPESVLLDVYTLPNVQLVKDSSGSPERRAIALAARQAKPGLRLFNGDEFRCLDYLEAGYDGLLFGGAVATGRDLHRLVGHFMAGRRTEAQQADRETKELLTGIYGGPSLTCWLAGLKYFMLRRGVFSTTTSFLGYPLTDDCRSFIERHAMPQPPRTPSPHAASL